MPSLLTGRCLLDVRGERRHDFADACKPLPAGCLRSGPSTVKASNGNKWSAHGQISVSGGVAAPRLDLGAHMLANIALQRTRHASRSYSPSAHTIHWPVRGVVAGTAHFHVPARLGPRAVTSRCNVASPLADAADRMHVANTPSGRPAKVRSHLACAHCNARQTRSDELHARSAAIMERSLPRVRRRNGRAADARMARMLNRQA